MHGPHGLGERVDLHPMRHQASDSGEPISLVGRQDLSDSENPSQQISGITEEYQREVFETMEYPTFAHKLYQSYIHKGMSHLQAYKRVGGMIQESFREKKDIRESRARVAHQQQWRYLEYY